MNKALVSILYLVILSYSLRAQTPCQRANNLLDIIRKHHLKSLPNDDVFSGRVFTGLLDLLDPERLYFTKKDSVQLSSIKFQIDDWLLNGTCTLPAIAGPYIKAIKSYGSFTDSLLQRPLNFT